MSAGTLTGIAIPVLRQSVTAGSLEGNRLGGPDMRSRDPGRSWRPRGHILADSPLSRGRGPATSRKDHR